MVGCLHINMSRNGDVVDAQQALYLGSVCVGQGRTSNVARRSMGFWPFMLVQLFITSRA